MEKGANMDQVVRLQTKNEPAVDVQKGRLTVSCGANVEVLEDMAFTSLASLRKSMREVLNIGNEHNLVLVNGKEVGDIDEGKIILNGDEEIEFKKPSGRKGRSRE